MVKYPPADAVDAGDIGSIPGSGRSPGLIVLNRQSVHALVEWCYLSKDLRKQVRGSLEKGIRSPNKGFCP